MAFATLTLQKGAAVIVAGGVATVDTRLAAVATNGLTDEKNLIIPLGVSLTFTTFAIKNNTYGDY